MSVPANHPEFSRHREPFHPGQHVGRFIIRRALGQGGMGEVYLAEDSILPRCVAVKRVRSDFSSDPGERDRILDEARLAARLSGGAIAGVYDVFQENGDFILVMEYVQGRTLRELLTGPVALDTFWDLALQCVQILESAHREGLVHRDIKPENIMVSDSGQVRLLDFGIARRLPGATLRTTEATDRLTEPGVVGTPAYMAPEALRGEELDASSDLYSLGVIFYEMLGGRRPFQGDTAAMLAVRILEGEPEPLLSVRPDAPPALAAVVHRLLARDPRDRYASAVGVAEDLTQAHRGGLKVRTLRVPIRVPRRLRHRLRAAAIGLPVLAVVTGGLLVAADQSVRLAARRAAGLNVLPDRRQVAVLPIAVDSQDPALAYLGGGLTEFVGDALDREARDAGFQVMPSRLTREEKVTSAAAARSRLGANLALLTRLTPQGNGIQVETRVVDAASGRLLNRTRTEVPATDVFALARSAVDQALRLLGRRASPDSLPGGFGTRAPGAFRGYLIGQGQLLVAKTPAEMSASVRTLERATRVDPGYGPALRRLAQAHIRLDELSPDPGQLAAARAVALRAAATDSASADAHRILGYAYSRAGRADSAEAEYRESIRLAPGLEDGYFYLGTFLARHRRYRDAVEVYRDAVERIPECWQPCWWLGSLLFRMGRYDQAREAFRELTRRGPDNYRGYANLGGILVLQGAYTEGLEALERANALKPGVVAWSNIGTARFNLRRFEGAIAAYQTALQFDYDDPEVWANLGDAEWWAPGRGGSAADAYREALTSARKLLGDARSAPGAHALMADVFPKLGEADSARVHLAEALAGAPDDVNILYRAALTHWQLADTTAALECLERSVTGGYPPAWVRDSAVFDAWRPSPRFQVLVGSAGGDPGSPASTSPKGE